MAGHTRPRGRPNPVLVFVAGAAVVAAVMVPVLLLGGGDVPVGGGTTTTTAVTSTIQPVGTTSTTSPVTTTTTAETTTTPASAVEPWTGVLYLYQTPENSFLGNPALVPIEVELTDLSGELVADDSFTEALAVIGGELPELSSPLANAVPADVRTNSINGSETETGHLLEVDMNEAFVAGAGGLLADVTMLNQIIYTLTWSPFLTNPEVLFTVDGEPVEAFGSEGIDLTQPVNRESFQEDLALIYLTEPVVELGGFYQVAGVANVFEASLIVQVVDADGDVVHEEPVMATCGTGCWGTFATQIAPSLVTPGESAIRLFTYSAEDGTMTDVVTVPVPADGVWQITIG